MTTRAPWPTASYRLQLQPAFTLADAEAAVPYLAGLGVSHLHLSPLLEAAPGSTHGYDTVDHGRISEQLGGERALRSLAAAARAHGLGLIADVVPNHMAVPVPERLNSPLWHVLRDGPGSPYARWFDIDWAAQGGRVLLPLLGDRLGAVLELGELKVDQDTLRYYDHVLPLRPGTAGLPLPELLRRQHYRLAWWRLADQELNYRRFFTINDLIALRVEDPEVFAATHGVLLRLRAEGVLDGFRVDHPDGLADPAGYLARLAAASGGAYTVVEKILTGTERLPADWACAGTTGYDALRYVDGVLTDGAGARRLAALYAEYTGVRGGAAQAARVGRAELVAGELAAEVSRLVRLAGRIGAAEVELADFSPEAVREALRELLAHYTVYRPYWHATERTVTTPADARQFVELLTQGHLGSSPAKDEFRARFAQTAAAVAAKGVEDTAFYRYHPLLSLNEVGGDPAHPGVEPADFHDWCCWLEQHWPHTMTALSTHDTKRSADARARLAVLAELPERWVEECTAWSALAGGLADRNAEWLLWQTLVAAWPIPPERLVGVLLKSLREAKQATRWTAPDPAYEAAVTDYARRVLAMPELVHRIDGFMAFLEPFAQSNSLSAALLHLTLPGVPDLYQGSELPLHTLVDPDNRAVVDFGAPATGEFARRKLHLTRTALGLRPSLGPYRALAADPHLVAFRRGPEVTVLAPRLPYARATRAEPLRCELAGRWRDLLSETEFTGAVTGAALLVREA
ncbi:malto-oligosyltrehalose synthase [Kitasatospora viridis]|uniref:Maltooligosyl trehalose synthase n=1 Tax=Kitasatospora viridis TaxID=281105 RepID=A0A561UMG1_9ACTN|nr:malto-oligosyltrehalose synthase [Kitasatospora viridis]TWG00568.1 maltooligosyl trehalose synthase [Kitasatospora viridis]